MNATNSKDVSHRRESSDSRDSRDCKTSAAAGTTAAAVKGPKIPFNGIFMSFGATAR
jgi:hypothetical protein